MLIRTNDYSVRIVSGGKRRLKQFFLEKFINIKIFLYTVYFRINIESFCVTIFLFFKELVVCELARNQHQHRSRLHHVFVYEIPTNFVSI